MRVGRNLASRARLAVCCQPRIAGHAKPSVTLDVYAHLFRRGIEEAAVRFDPLGPGRLEVDGAGAVRL